MPSLQRIGAVSGNGTPAAAKTVDDAFAIVMAHQKAEFDSMNFTYLEQNVFVINQLEENPVVTSYQVTKGEFYLSVDSQTGELTWLYSTGDISHAEVTVTYGATTHYLAGSSTIKVHTLKAQQPNYAPEPITFKYGETKVVPTEGLLESPEVSFSIHSGGDNLHRIRYGGQRGRGAGRGHRRDPDGYDG